MNKKIIVSFILLLFVLCILPTSVSAESQDDIDMQEYYQQEYDESGAENLYDNLPDDTKDILDDFGIDNGAVTEDTQLSPSRVYKSLWNTLKDKITDPIKAIAGVIAIILLCALAESMKLSFGEKTLGSTVSVVGTLGVSLVIISPIVSCISYTSNMILTAAIFIAAYIPVAVGLMIASSATFSALSYNFLMLGAGEVISQLCKWFILPLLNVFLALSIVASISPDLRLNKIADMFSSISKWVLGIVTTVFVGLLTLENIVTSSADSATGRAVKFAINSFIPIVGSALSDAYTTIHSCVKMLSSGVGVFAIIVIAIIFIPIFIQCLIWIFTVKLSASIADMFAISSITNLLNSVSKVMGVMLAIIICCMVVFLVSTVIILSMGGGSAT